MSATEISKISFISRGSGRVVPEHSSRNDNLRVLFILLALTTEPPANEANIANLERRMTATASVSRPLRKLLAAGPAIYRDGNTLIAGDACPAELLPELEALCLPRISEADGKAVVALLKEHAGRVRYVVEREEAVDVVAELHAG